MAQVENVYGYCPKCGAPGKQRERRPNGNDICENGHEYPSRDALVKEKSKFFIKINKPYRCDVVIRDKHGHLFAASPDTSAAVFTSEELPEAILTIHEQVKYHTDWDIIVKIIE